MTTIIPRWEWRTFGRGFGPVADEVAARTDVRIEESDEIYLLAPGGENVKVRDELLDIKVLRETNTAGLERWEPILKAPFPLSPADVAVAFEVLRQPLPALGREAYTFDQFIAELIEPSPAIRVVPVHKLRRRTTVQGCMAELSDVDAAGRRGRTIALETEDPATVLAAVRTVGLGERVNTSFPEGLTLLIDGEPPRYAVIDCGTNSIKFHVGERSDGGTWSVVVDRAEITRLGEDMEATGRISREAIERTAAAVDDMAAESRALHARAIAAVGTAGLRAASNGDEAIRAIDEATGIGVQVISGEEESRLAYLAVRAGLGALHGPVVVFDSGGGSTQFTFGEGDDVLARFSLEVGAVRYTERFRLDGAVSADVLAEALEAIAADLARLDGAPRPDAVVGMGGTVTNLTAVSLPLDPYDPDRVQGATLDRAEIDRQIEQYRTRDADARRAIVGLQPKRADVILAGACIVRTVLDRLGQDVLTVSDRGLRHGVLLERFALTPD